MNWHVARQSRGIWRVNSRAKESDMATVRKYRGRYVADFRDQLGRRRIEAPRGKFESLALEKRAAQELLNRRLLEVQSGQFQPASAKPRFQEVCSRFIDCKVNLRPNDPGPAT